MPHTTSPCKKAGLGFWPRNPAPPEQVVSLAWREVFGSVVTFYQLAVWSSGMILAQGDRSGCGNSEHSWRSAWTLRVPATPPERVRPVYDF